MMITIHEATENAWNDLRLIRLKALKADPTAFSSSYEKEITYKDMEWQAYLSRQKKAVFLIYAHNNVIGLTGIMQKPERPEIAFIWGSWLDPAWRGQGLITKAYQNCIAWAKAQKTIQKIIISHRASNQASQKLIAKAGFQFTHSENKIWPDGQNEKSLHYELNIK